MNIDIESVGLLSLILQDSPKDRLLILCVLARSNSVPARLNFHPNTDYPTFYGYANSRIPFYLMGKGVLSNVPREGYAKRLISAYYLSFAETLINKNKNWAIHQKLMGVSKFITLDNRTTYKDAEVFLVFRDKAIDYIKDYASSHKDEISSFLGLELSKEIFGQTRSAYVDAAKEDQKQNPPDTKQGISVPVGVEYNSITHKIQFAEKDIPIPSDTDQDSLCKTIFKNKQTKTKEWNWDEMLVSWGGNYEDKNQWRKVYNAGREVNTKIATETTIKDLLIVRKLTIAVNPKYLG